MDDTDVDRAALGDGGIGQFLGDCENQTGDRAISKESARVGSGANYLGGATHRLALPSSGLRIPFHGFTAYRIGKEVRPRITRLELHTGGPAS